MTDANQKREGNTMRPASHREQVPPQRCGNCLYGMIPEWKQHLLCFFGDEFTTQPSFVQAGCDDVLLNGEPVGLLDGDEYDAVWGGRAVDDTDVCDCWMADEGPRTAPPDAVARAREIVLRDEWSGDMRANLTRIIGAGRVLNRALALARADVQRLRWELKDDRRSAQPVDDETSEDRDTATYLERFADWLLRELAAGTHGCLTGDCPHDSQRECVLDLLRAFDAVERGTEP